MYALRLVPIYIWWHYTAAFVDMFRIAGNLFWFLWHFFSIPDTLRTFFSPWHRLHETNHKKFDLEAAASSFVVNTLMRIVGMIMRSLLILLAFCGFVVVLVVVIASFCVWIILPFALIGLTILGLTYFFK